MNKSHLLGAVCACVLMFTTISANAAIATWEFTGTMGAIVPHNNPTVPPEIASLFSAGDAYSATVTVNLDSPATPSSGVANFAGSIIASTFNIPASGFAWELTTFGNDGVNLTSGNTQFYIPQADTGTSSSPKSDTTFSFNDTNNLQPTTLNGFANNFDLNNFEFASGSMLFSSGCGTFCSRADFTIATASVTVSTVPVPAAIWLFGSGLIGLTGFARQRKV